MGTAQHCRFGLCQDSDFAGDLEDSTSTSVGMLCVFGSRVRCLVCGCLCCCRDPGDCLSLVLVWSLPLLLSKDFWSGMGSDGFQAERRGSWILGKERAERVLAGAISIDGRKEWVSKFCSESNVWTKWRCRRCYNDIPAGLRGKYSQAIAASTRECSTGSSTSSGEEDRKSRSQEAENKELRARLEALQKKEGERAQ